MKKRKKTAKSTLSFALHHEEENGDSNGASPSPALEDGDEKPAKRPKSRKNPNVDTSFLPDREREEAERREREELRQEWLRKQEEMKKEEIEITYSYWDGSGHRKSVKVSTIRGFHSNVAPDHIEHAWDANVALRSARRAMISPHSLRNVDSKYQNSGV